MKLKSFVLDMMAVFADKITMIFFRKRVVWKCGKFSFCKIPVPKNYLQSQTHPSILYFSNKWKNHTHILATTPYPNADIRCENPCLYYALSEDSPTVFEPNPHNPIIPAPTNIDAFNSDPCLFFENDRLYLLNRRCENMPGLREIEMCYSDNGVDFSQAQIVISSQAQKKELLSPAVIRYNNKKRIYFLNGDAGISKKGRCSGIDIYEGNSFEKADFTHIKTSRFMNSEETGIEPWHFDLFEFENKLYMVLCGRNKHQKSLRNPMNIYLAVSDDYENFYIFSTPLVKRLKTYRPTAYIDEMATLHLYFSVIGNVAKDCSDRAIALTKIDFRDLLKTIDT